MSRAPALMRYLQRKTESRARGPAVATVSPVRLLLASVLIVAVANGGQEARTQELKTEDDRQLWVCALDLDSGQSRRLFPLTDVQAVKSMAVSADGRRILLVASRLSDSGETPRILVCDADGKNLQDLGRGLTASWSPRGQRITFSRRDPEQGVWLMRRDGSGQQLVDSKGISVQWSPHGRIIGYERTGERGSGFILFNMVENDFRRIECDVPLERHTATGRFSWSPDSRRICLSTVNDESTHCVGLVEVGANGAMQICYRHDGRIAPEPDWLDKQRLVISHWSAELGCAQLFSVDASSSEADPVPTHRREAVRWIEGQIPNRVNRAPDVSPDGRTIFYLSEPVAG